MAIKTSIVPADLKHLSKNDLIAELYNRYGKKLCNYALNSWHLKEDDAWDLTYKTLYKVLESFQNYKFESEEKFASYVFKIFINYLRNHYRDHQKDSEKLNQSDIDVATLENKAELNANDFAGHPQMNLLNDALDQMEDWQRILLLMRSDGVAYSEIAKYIDKPEEQLKVYYQRLKEQLTKKLYGKL